MSDWHKVADLRSAEIVHLTQELADTRAKAERYEQVILAADKVFGDIIGVTNQKLEAGEDWCPEWFVKLFHQANSFEDDHAELLDALELAAALTPTNTEES